MEKIVNYLSFERCLWNFFCKKATKEQHNAKKNRQGNSFICMLNNGKSAFANVDKRAFYHYYYTFFLFLCSFARSIVIKDVQHK